MVTLNHLSRVAIVGTSCSGKTTLARNLANILEAPRIEMDALHWGPNWTETPAHQFRLAIDEATARTRWVCDGNYRVVRDLVWARATSIIWLDYSFPVVFTRALRRTVTRSFRRTTLYSGNRETFAKSFLSRDSILLWVLKSHWRIRREYSQVLADSADEGVHVLRLNSPANAAEFLAAASQLVASPALNSCIK